MVDLAYHKPYILTIRYGDLMYDNPRSRMAKKKKPYSVHTYMDYFLDLISNNDEDYRREIQQVLKSKPTALQLFDVLNLEEANEEHFQNVVLFKFLLISRVLNSGSQLYILEPSLAQKLIPLELDGSAYEKFALPHESFYINTVSSKLSIPTYETLFTQEIASSRERKRMLQDLLSSRDTSEEDFFDVCKADLLGANVLNISEIIKSESDFLRRRISNFYGLDINMTENHDRNPIIGLVLDFLPVHSPIHETYTVSVIGTLHDFRYNLLELLKKEMDLIIHFANQKYRHAPARIRSLIAPFKEDCENMMQTNLIEICYLLVDTILYIIDSKSSFKSINNRADYNKRKKLAKKKRKPFKETPPPAGTVSYLTGGSKLPPAFQNAYDYMVNQDEKEGGRVPRASREHVVRGHYHSFWVSERHPAFEDATGPERDVEIRGEIRKRRLISKWVDSFKRGTKQSEEDVGIESQTRFLK